MIFKDLGIIRKVMQMKTSKDILSSLLKTTQMGQVGIRSVMKKPVSAQLRGELESQLREYDSIESEAHAIASKRGWEVAELNKGVRAMSDMMTRMKLMYQCNDSKIAGMMIQGNTKGMIKGLKNIHQYPRQDDRICGISQKLIDCETAMIRQMQSFL